MTDEYVCDNCEAVVDYLYNDSFCEECYNQAGIDRGEAINDLD